MIAVSVLLAVAVACVWLACQGFLRLSSVYDRVHCVTFAGIAAGAPVTIAVFVHAGASSAAFKVLLIFVLTGISGAALAHAVGRAIAFREAAGQGE